MTNRKPVANIKLPKYIKPLLERHGNAMISDIYINAMTPEGVRIAVKQQLKMNAKVEQGVYGDWIITVVGD